MLARLRQAAINVPVIVQTAHGGIDNVVSAMRAGAIDFVVKPVGLERLQVSLRNALNTSALEDELQRIKHSRSGTLGFDDIITKSPSMQAVLQMAEKAATSNIPVLISGESGVGKELIACAIHGSGERQGQTIRRGELRRDAGKPRRVDPVRSREGLVHRRHRTPHRQIRRSLRRHLVPRRGRRTAARGAGETLRAIQEGEVETVGGRRPIKVDVRIVSATNRDLIADVKAGRFREDLFYRLHVFPITVPPLRDRLSDIPGACPAFPGAFRRRRGQADPPDHP